MANKKLSATITIGGSVAGSLRSAFGSASKSITQLGSELTRLNARQKELNRTITDQEKLGRMGSALKVKYAQDELRMVDRQIIAVNRQIAAEKRLHAAIKDNATKKAEIRGKLTETMAIGAGLAASTGVPIYEAVKFETAMLGVAKQLDGARDSSGKLTQTYFDMAKSIQVMGREIPNSTNSIAEMVSAGLRMGVAKENVLDFVRTSAKMATAFELPEGELADQMGKIATLYRIPIPQIERLADSINYLDDNAISKGGDIIDFLQRVGGVASSVKITGQNMAAIGSTLLTMGERSETASTATNAFFQKLAAAEKGTKKFHEALAEIGLRDKDIQKGMQTDALGTMIKVLEKVNKLKPEKRLGVLVEMVGLEHSDTIAKLAGNVDELRKQIALANSEAAKGSMDREFQARLATTAAQAQIAKNRVTELGVSIGSILLPSVNSTLGAVGPMVTKFAEWSEKYPMVTKSIVGLGTAFLGLRVGILAARYAWLIMSGLMLTNPITATITAVAAGATLIVQNWEPLSAFFKSLWTDITGTFRLAIAEITLGIEWVTNKYQAAKDLVSGAVGSGNQAGAEAMMDSMPGLPAPAARGGSYQDNSQNTIQVTQQPGENQQDLAKRVAEEIERNRKARERAAMYDGAYAQ